MTAEELKLLQRYPRTPERLVPGFVAEVKQGRAIAEGAKQAAERGIVAKAVRIKQR